MCRGELTRNDAIFVLVATLSPATLYLWTTGFIALFNKGFLPDYFNESLSKFGQRMLIFLSIMSFILWLVVVALALRPPNSVYFSQPACDKTYGKDMFFILFWSAKFFLCFFMAVAVVSGIAQYRRKHMDRRGAPTDL